MLQIHYIAKIIENISVTVLSFCANYIKQAAHLCFGNNVTCYMSAIIVICTTLLCLFLLLHCILLCTLVIP